MKKMNKKGFTIVELVIVIAVIAILAAVMIPTFSGVVDKANQSKALQQGRNYYTAMYADDLADGTVDGNVASGTAVTTPASGCAYTPSATPVFAYDAGNGWVAQYDGSEWTVVEDQ